jgi:hypothetical protein
MPIDEARLDAAIEALTNRERMREAEALVASAAPKLQRVLRGWFGEAQTDQVRKAAGEPGEEERVIAVRTLLAEEARMGMLVGVAVGWALAEELRETNQED